MIEITHLFFFSVTAEVTTDSTQHNQEHAHSSTPLYGIKDYATYGSDEDYAKKLFMSRSAKVKRWCSNKAEHIEDKFPIRNRHRRSNSSASTRSVPVQESRRFSTATNTGRIPRDDFNMPTILVTTEEDHRKAADDNHEMVDIIPWVDWLEEYKIIKAREIRRRSSTQGNIMSNVDSTELPFGSKQLPSGPSSLSTPGSESHGSSVVNRVLSNWWNNVKTGAEHYSKSRHQHNKKDGKGKAPVFEAIQEPLTTESIPPPSLSRPQSQRVSQHPKRNSLNLSLDLQELQHPLEPQIRPFIVDASNSPALVGSTDRRWPVRDMDTDSMSPMSLQNQDSISTPSSIPDSPMSLAHRISFPKNPITQTTLAKRVGYRFYNPGSRMGTFSQLSHVFGNRQEDDNSAIRIQHSIKSRIQFAKEACNAELRQIIDGLNEYVERGLQYVEDMDEILEEGVHSIGSLDTDEEVEEDDGNYDDDECRTIGPHHKPNISVGTTTTSTVIPPTTAGITSSPVVNPDMYMHQLPSVVEIDETPSPPSGHQQDITNSFSTNKLPHKRSLSSAMDNDNQLIEPSFHKSFAISPSSATARAIIPATPANCLPPSTTNDDTTSLPPTTSSNAMVALISEDSYLPTPFILTLQDLISVAQNVMDTSLDEIIETSGACADALARIQAIGVQWDIHPEWPCREWYVRLILGIAALNRVVTWWAAERDFWNVNGNGGVGNGNNHSSGIMTTMSSVAPSDAEGDDMDTASNLSPMEETEDEESHMSLDDVESQRSTSTRIRASESNVQLNVEKNQDVEDEQLGSLKLQEEAERSQSSTIIVELSLGTTTVQYVSPVWFDVVG